MQKSCLIDQEVHGSILKALKITFTDKKKKKRSSAWIWIRNDENYKKIGLFSFG